MVCSLHSLLLRVTWWQHSLSLHPNIAPGLRLCNTSSSMVHEGRNDLIYMWQLNGGRQMQKTLVQVKSLLETCFLLICNVTDIFVNLWGNVLAQSPLISDAGINGIVWSVWGLVTVVVIIGERNWFYLVASQLAFCKTCNEIWLTLAFKSLTYLKPFNLSGFIGKLTCIMV